jgi:hypothetical protein
MNATVLPAAARNPELPYGTEWDVETNRRTMAVQPDIIIRQ